MNEILNTFKTVSTEYIGNSNSSHRLGAESKKLENAATKQMLDIFNLSNKEVIYTSGRCESNNLCILGYLEKYKNKSKKIITSRKEHSSIILSLESLKEYGLIIQYIDINDNRIDINKLKELIDKDTVLICLSNYENIDKVFDFNIATFIDNRFDVIYEYDKAAFLGFELLEFIGIGCLIKNKNLVLEPLFYGGKSVTNYRSGTPQLPLIVSFAKGIKIMYKK